MRAWSAFDSRAHDDDDSEEGPLDKVPPSRAEWVICMAVASNDPTRAREYFAAWRWSEVYEAYGAQVALMPPPPKLPTHGRE